MNAYGQVTEERYRNGITTMRTFDSRSGRLTDIDTRKGTAVLQNNKYAWKTNGILQRRENNRDSTHVKKESFAYDALNRLERAESYLNGAATASRTLTMQYDRLGNLTGKTSDVTGDTDVVYASGAAALPGRNARIGVTIGPSAYTLVHDAHGQVTHYNLGSATEKYLAWNARHLPTTVTVGDSLTDTSPVARDEFAYGPGGARYYKKSTWTVEGTAPDQDTYPTEHTFYVGGFKEVIGAADSVQTTQVTDNVLHVRTTPDGGTATTTYEYLHRDHLGSVESVTDAAGLELRVMAYDPFGERRASDWMGELDDDGRQAIADDASVKTSRGYTGHEHLERTGLIHMNGRVYDPVLGRFLSPDPVVADATYSQSWNAYSYALNSPLSFTDPSGHIVRPSGGRMGGCSPSICMNFDGASPGGGASHGAIGVNTRYREVYDERYVQSTTVISVGTFGNSSGLPNDITSPAGTRSQLKRLLNRLSFDSVREVRYTETSYSVLAQQFQPESGDIDEPTGLVGRVFDLIFPAVNAQDIVVKLSPTRVRVWRSVDNETGRHNYAIQGTICSGGLGCDEALADMVFAHVNQNDISFTYDDLGNRQRILIGNQPIYHFEYISLRMSASVTSEGHMFHPGSVVHSVFFSHGTLYYRVDGSGTGAAPNFNNNLGITLLGPGVNHVVDKFWR